MDMRTTNMRNMRQNGKTQRVLGSVVFAAMLGLVLSLAGFQAQGQVLMHDSELSDIPLEQLEKKTSAGDSEAQYELGLRYIAGTGGAEKDTDKGIGLLRQAAKKGYILAQYDLCAIYWNGELVEQNSDTAIDWCKKAADKNYVIAQYTLGLIYSRGKGAFRGTDWARASVKLGNESLLDVLGISGIFKRKNVDKNHKLAAQWFTEAAERDYAPAQYSLGFSYWKGKGVREQRDTAIAWWKKAAEQQYCYAEHVLGLVYWKGKRVRENPKRAADWFEKAAEQGVAEAQYYLGRAYEQGEGKIQNYPEAYIWFSVSAARGDKDARKRRNKTEKNISLDEKTEADNTILQKVELLKEEEECI